MPIVSDGVGNLLKSKVFPSGPVLVLAGIAHASLMVRQGGTALPQLVDTTEIEISDAGLRSFQFHEFTNPYKAPHVSAAFHLLPGDGDYVCGTGSVVGGRHAAADWRDESRGLSDGRHDHVSAGIHIVAGTSDKERDGGGCVCSSDTRQWCHDSGQSLSPAHLVCESRLFHCAHLYSFFLSPPDLIPHLSCIPRAARLCRLSGR